MKINKDIKKLKDGKANKHQRKMKKVAKEAKKYLKLEEEEIKTKKHVPLFKKFISKEHKVV